MSVAKMKLVSITGPRDALDRVTEVCGRCGVFQPENPLSFYSDTSDFVALNEDCPYSAPLAELTAAAKSVGGKPDEQAAPSAWEAAQLLQYADDFSKKAAELNGRVSTLSAELEKCARDAEQFEHFKGLNIGLDDLLNCETIKARFGKLPKESYQKLDIYADDPFAMFFPGSADSNYYWGVYFAPQDRSDDVDRLFSSLYFERMHIHAILPDETGTPEEILTSLHRRQTETSQQLAEAQEAVRTWYAQERETCDRVLARLREMEYYFRIRHYAVQYKNSSVLLAGWIPAREEADFLSQISAIDGVEYTTEKPENVAHHTPPVKLHNFPLFRAYEYFVDMYGMPTYNEIDPTAFVAITYTLLFGIMFGDLGQGLIVALVGAWMWKKKQMPIGRILIPCGISAAVCGTVFGSVFGFEHALDGFYRLLGFAEKPIDVMESAVSIILFAVCVGLALIVISMCLNIYSAIKRRDWENALFGPNGVAGLVFFGSLVAGFGGQLAFGLKIVTLPYLLCLVALPLLLIFLREPLGKLVAGKKDWAPEKWGEFCVQNFFEVFEILLTYLSNTMSFMRVGAFVLIHAGMMLAVFTLAGLFGPFGYTVTVVLGNLLVMVMEALLVAIQVMRLEFYEMFSRYYTGEGRPFTPLKLNK